MLKFIAIITSFLFIHSSEASTCLSQNDVQLLKTPLSSVHDSIQFVRNLGLKFRACKDNRGLFAEVYFATLINIQNEVKKGSFENADLIQKMLVEHTDLYRYALYLEQSNQLFKAPLSWQKTFHAHSNYKVKPGTLLILAMNAHIAFDLTKTLVDLNVPFKNESFARDYNKVSLVLENSMNQLWNAFRIYDQNPTVIGKNAEINLMLSWVVWLRKKAWEDAQYCSKFDSMRLDCLEELNMETGNSASIYKKLNFLVH